MNERGWIVILNWAWGGVSIASGLLVTFMSGWTLLHAHTSLFCIVLGSFGLSLLMVTALLTTGGVGHDCRRAVDGGGAPRTADPSVV